MKKHYTNWLSYVRGVFVAAVLLVSGNLAMAQLSGVYTIDSSTATGGSNFQSFTDFASELNSSGVKGAVTVNVVAASGPYYETVIFKAATGSSSTNTITINGNGEKISGTGSVIELDSADYMTFNNLVVENTGTSTGSRGFWLHNQADYNTITNCDIIFTSYTGSSSSTAYISMSGSETGHSNSNAPHGSYNTISGNDMYGSSNSVGPYYGVDIYNTSGSRATGNMIDGNDVRDYYYYGSYTYGSDDLEVTDNSFHHLRSDAGSAYGIYLAYCDVAKGNVLVEGNDIHDVSISSTFYVTYATNVDGSKSTPFSVSDNVCSKVEANAMYGYRQATCTYGNVDGNIISDSKLSDRMYYALYTGSCNNVTVENNEIKNNSMSGTYGLYYLLYNTSSQYCAYTGNIISGNKCSGTYGMYYGIYNNNSDYSPFTYNKIIKNDFDVSSYGFYYGVYNYYSDYSPFSFNEISDNVIDASYGFYYGIRNYYSNNSDLEGNIVSNNEIDATSYGMYYLFYNYRATNSSCIDNKIFENEINSSSYSSYNMFYNYYGDELSGNEVYDNSGSYYFYYTFYNYYGGDMKENIMSGNSAYAFYYTFRNYYGSSNEMSDNQMVGNSADYYFYYVFESYYSTNDVMQRNIMKDNTSGNYMGYALSIYYSQGGTTCKNNVVVNNTASTGMPYMVYMYQSYNNVTFAHNTIALGGSPGYYYGMYVYASGSVTNSVIKNNIFYFDVNTTGTVYPMYGNTGSDNYEWGSNVFWVPNGGTTWYMGGSGYSSYNAWISAANDKTSVNVDPKFEDLKNGDLTPTNPVIANIGEQGLAALDYDLETRTKCGPDPGAFEFFIDHSASDLVFTGKKECGGYMEPIKFTFNNGASIDLDNPKVYYSINGGSPVIEEIKQVKASSSYDYTFETVPAFHTPGTNTIEVGLLCDDNSANNTVTTTIDITPAPHSFEFSEGPNFPGYYNAGTENNPDVTVPGKEVEYVVENPAARYPNADHGSDWELKVSAMTMNGTPVTAGITLNKPAGSSKGMLKYDPDASMADSLIFMSLTVTDYTTGCDSVFGRWIYVPHTPKVAWESAGGCDGDVISFINGTKQETGATEYSWTFGDPNSGDDNTSEISDPVHRFTTYGTYDVTMNAWNFDYPKFVYTLTKQVVVDPVPTVNFQVINACEGKDIAFKNNTTLPSGVSGTIDYTWNFGDGSATSAMENPNHQYSKAGGFKVTLTANLKGCAASITKNANQFATPTADFSVSGKCNLEEIEFMNASTISLGRTGYKWNFNDGSVSNLSNPMHAFATPGDHTVKLVAVSEFGCTDEVEKTFTLNESPRADFSFTDACSNTPVEFTREGSLPSGANSIFEWDFDGEKTSTKENDSYQFSTVGVKNVSLKVSSDNGCSDMIAKEFVVKLQAKADFLATDVCEGEDVVFTNKSSVASGNLNYQWRFGDGTPSSDLTSPRHSYELVTSGVTESFQVTLLALVPGGCSDSIARTVTVNASADPSFDVTANWRNLIITNQATTDPTNQYNWRFGDGGRSNDVTPSYKYAVDQDEFEVCLAIINNAGCISEHCEMVAVDLGSSSVTDIASTDIFTVYPNPNTGVFNVKVENPSSNLSVSIMDATGKIIKTVSTDMSGVYEVDLSDVASGVYMVQVINGGYSAMQRVTVAK